ncbi:hypothetical protein M3225_26915 [Priestia aryabhattai]|uniref:hypothetical protein n=1 Tax=Priestia aryabhattai TaxID=412384 RepID=UPI00203F1C4A|nr:hypothetical protein [Priestia aryabhattai]MCM3774052.1 hypothetical protein [Priestia aryabhattai]
MENFVESLVEHRLSKEVKELLRLNKFPVLAKQNNVRAHLQELLHKGIIPKSDYLFFEARMLLNEYSMKIEKEIGCDGTAFMFYCANVNKMYFGAGPNFPLAMREIYNDKPPAWDFIYYDDDVIVTQDAPNDLPFKHQAKTIVEVKALSGFSLLLRVGGTCLGSFEVHWNRKNAVKPGDVEYVREELKQVSKALYNIRHEMLDTLKSEKVCIAYR